MSDDLDDIRESMFSRWFWRIILAIAVVSAIALFIIEVLK